VLSSLATCLAVNALFYGATFKTPMSESATTLFVTIVAAIVPLLGKIFFQKHKLNFHDIDKDKRIAKKNSRNKKISYHVGCNFLCFLCQSCLENRERKKKEKNDAKIKRLNKMVDNRIELTKTQRVGSFRKSLKRTFSIRHDENEFGFHDIKAQEQIKKLSSEETPFSSVHELFNFLDKDGTQRVSKLGLRDGMLAQGHISAPGDVEEVMRHIDCDEEGVITLEKFKKVIGGRVSLRTESEMLGNTERLDEMRRPMLTPKLIQEPLSKELCDVHSGISGDSKIGGDKEAFLSRVPTQNERNSADSKEISKKSGNFEVDDPIIPLPCGGATQDRGKSSKDVKGKRLLLADFEENHPTIKPDLAHDAMLAPTPALCSAPRPQPLLVLCPDNDNRSASRTEQKNGINIGQANHPDIAMTITRSGIVRCESTDRSLYLAQKSDSQKLQENTFEVCSSIETEDEKKFDIGLAAMADLYMQNKIRRSVFNYAETEFWISNRIAPLIGQNINLTLRKIKKIEAIQLVEAQEFALKKSNMIPKLLFKATWVFCPAWFLFMIFVIFAWGVNMDSNASVVPNKELVRAARSNCPTRETYTAGASLSVDVHGLDLLNLQGAQYRANEKNKNFERYGNNLGFGSFRLLSDDVSESYRFVVSSMASWMAGTILLPIGSYVVSATLLSVLFMKKNKKLKKNIAQEKTFHLAAASNLHEDDHVLLLSCWPEALLKILSENDNEEDDIKLNFVSGNWVEKFIDIVASNLF